MSQSPKKHTKGSASRADPLSFLCILECVGYCIHVLRGDLYKTMSMAYVGFTETNSKVLDFEGFIRGIRALLK